MTWLQYASIPEGEKGVSGWLCRIGAYCMDTIARRSGEIGGKYIRSIVAVS